jgi:type II restriction enzyme
MALSSQAMEQAVFPTTLAAQRDALIDRWKADPHATYRTWFLWEERLKNFRSIRRGIGQLVREIEGGTFGNAYRGSTLETVVSSIAEQRQIFKGADHAFLWKPKLRIPDIYENEDNQRAFGRLLHACDCCDTAEAVIDAIRRLETQQIKGLGPAVANLLYFIHPTLVVPFNTAIVRGYNALTGSKVKLGRWDHYLSMREGVMRLNAGHRSRLSNDLGAVAGLLFDIGSGRYDAPPQEHDLVAARSWQADLARVREETTAQHRQWSLDRESDTTHTEIQGWLRDLGLGLGFEVWIAANDRSREFQDGRLADGCRERLPDELNGAAESVRLIDVVWFEAGGVRVVAAFEVEHSTSIYSGIVRMLDLALGSALASGTTMFLVAPDDRRDEVAQQLRRPAFSRVSELGIRYLSYGELRANRAAIHRFGAGLRPLLQISQTL